jgi:hypothetical protein
MADLVIIVPSRGRPEAAQELWQAFGDTCTADTQLVFALDDNDPTRVGYPDEPAIWTGPSRSMVEALNGAATASVDGMFGFVAPFAIGFMGDDHRPRTKGWDTAYLDALRELGTGIVYGNDLLQGQRIPTQCAMTADIVQALGFMVPPVFTHLYVDNYWLELGTRAECIRYLPDVVVEHRHPVAGKGLWDEGYERVNNPDMYAKDQAAFNDYLMGGMVSDAGKVWALRPNRELGEVADGNRVRLRPVHDSETLARIYASPHDHSKWSDHKVRVAITAQFAHLLAGRVGSGADLSCGDGTILKALNVGTRYLGDFAPGYPITGAIDDTIEQIPVVDLFVCCETLEHLDDPDATLKKIRTKTRTLVLSTPVDAFEDTNLEHYWAWSRAGVETMLAAAGFQVDVYTAIDFRPAGAEYQFGVWFCR